MDIRFTLPHPLKILRAENCTKFGLFSTHLSFDRQQIFRKQTPFYQSPMFFKRMTPI